MRVCVQRVSRAEVRVNEQVTGRIQSGLVVLLGIGHHDTAQDAHYLARKIAQLRIFNDDDGKMNRSLIATSGAMLVVSQFTLHGDCRKGRRPSFIAAAQPSQAEQLYDVFVDAVRELGVRVETGQFRAMMQVELVNDGPVTLLLDSQQLF